MVKQELPTEIIDLIIQFSLNIAIPYQLDKEIKQRKIVLSNLGYIDIVDGVVKYFDSCCNRINIKTLIENMDSNLFSMEGKQIVFKDLSNIELVLKHHLTIKGWKFCISNIGDKCKFLSITNAHIYYKLSELNKIGIFRYMPYNDDYDDSGRRLAIFGGVKCWIEK